MAEGQGFKRSFQSVSKRIDRNFWARGGILEVAVRLTPFSHWHRVTLLARQPGAGHYCHAASSHNENLCELAATILGLEMIGANGPKHRLRLIMTLCVLLVIKPTPVLAVADATGHPPRLLSAFFGLDNALPFRANLLCPCASGQDGMPVVLSHTVNPATLQSQDFQVVTRSGAKRMPHCVTLRPAQDSGELRTVLLIGEFGDLLADGPVPGESEPANFRGSRTAVTALDLGPSLVLAEQVPASKLAKETRGTVCPEGIEQVIRVTWAGGVRRPDRGEVGDAERQLYRVMIKRANGSSHEIAPVVLADLEDGDNNHLLCLDSTDQAISVRFPAGYLADPNGDLNLDTRIAIKSAGISCDNAYRC